MITHSTSDMDLVCHSRTLSPSTATVLPRVEPYMLNYPRSRSSPLQTATGGQQTLKSGKWPVLGRLRAARSEDTELLQSNREPEDVRGAIAVGLSLYEEEKYKEALDTFEKALNLPGTGTKRYRDKPRLISDGEKQSVLYNIACCYSRLGDARTGLVALAGCLESGYDDLQQLKTDPDLDYLRKDSRFDGLVDRFKLTTRKGFFQDFLKGFNL